jgi:hypothetical protein
LKEICLYAKDCSSVKICSIGLVHEKENCQHSTGADCRVKGRVWCVPCGVPEKKEKLNLENLRINLNTHLDTYTTATTGGTWVVDNNVNHD